jgi:hypothetical protein
VVEWKNKNIQQMRLDSILDADRDSESRRRFVRFAKVLIFSAGPLAG